MFLLDDSKASTSTGFSLKNKNLIAVAWIVTLYAGLNAASKVIEKYNW